MKNSIMYELDHISVRAIDYFDVKNKIECIGHYFSGCYEVVQCWQNFIACCIFTGEML